MNQKINRSESSALRSVPIWIRLGWSRSFELKRLGWHVLVIGPLSAVCAVSGHPWWSLVVLLIGFWPFPYRARWTDAGLEVRWLFVRECVGLAEIQGARLRVNERHSWAFGRQGVLEIALRARKPAIVVGRRSILDTLHAQVTTALSTRGAAHDE